MSPMNPAAAQARDCPSCGAVVPVDPLFTPWCESCGWNLVPLADPALSGRWAIAQRRFGKRVGEELAVEIRTHGVHRPRLTLSTAAAYLICAGVYSLIVALFWIGISTFVAGRITPLGFVVIGVSLILGLAMLPRPGRIEGEVLTRPDLPDLFSCLDALGDTLGCPRLDGVVIDAAVNASYGRYGYRQRRILTVGLPLYEALDQGARVALFGHELGHGINGDPTRGLVMGGAVDALRGLHRTLEPFELVPSDEGIGGYLALPLRLAQLGLSRAARGLASLLLMLLMRDGQRAEYYADAIAAKAAGRTAALALLDALVAVGIAEGFRTTSDVEDPIATFVRKVRSIPPRELDRARRVQRQRGSGLYHSHPPAVFRHEAIAAQAEFPPAYVLDDNLSGRIDAELSVYRAMMGSRMVDARLAAIHY
jgi:hypothetical protein